ncbi:MAG: PKD domain-containing protein [Bacteroidales bacterium]|nr:PKD domain-containing protein [Bacteroidales bacterium]
MKKNFFISQFFIFLWSFLYFSKLFAQIDTISGLSLWIRSDSGIVLDLAGRVKQWYDFSPNSFIFIQNDSLARPKLLIDNSFFCPTLYFDGLNDFFDGGNILNLSPTGNTIFILAKYKGNGSIVAKSLYGPANARYASLIMNNALLFLYQDNYDRSVLVPLQDSIFLVTINKNNSTNSINISINGIQKNTISFDGSYPMTSQYNFLIGAYNNEAGTIPPILFFNGYIYEIIFFNRNLTLHEQKNIENYLMNKIIPPLKLPEDTTLSLFCPFTIKPKKIYSSYLWNTGETTDSIVVTKSGIYSLTVTDIFGRVSSDSILINFPIGDDFLYERFLCLNDSITIHTNLDEQFYDFIWSNNYTSSYITIDTPGKYWFSIVDTANCIFHSDTINVYLDSIAFNDFLDDTTIICFGDTVKSNALDNSFSYLWSTNDTLSFILPNITGWYKLTVTNVNNCRKIDSTYVIIKGQKPVISWQKTHSCLNSPIKYSCFSEDSIQLCKWIFNNNDTLFGQEVYYQYQDSGVYLNTLNVISINNCETLLTFKDTIYDNPRAGLKYKLGCLGQNTILESNSIVQFNDSIVEYYWLINNQTYFGSIIQLDLNPGKFLIFHKVKTQHNCEDTILYNLNVKNPSLPLPALINFPSNNQNVLSDTVLFSWDNFNQLSYIKISYDSNFSNILIKSPLSYNNFFAYPVDSNKTVYWKIITFNECNDSIISSIYRFSTYKNFKNSYLSLWLMADSQVYTLNNRVYEWKDISNNQYILSQSNISFSPFRSISTILNNRYVIKFNGINNFLFGGKILPISARGNSFFILGNTNSSNGTFISKSLLGNAESRYSLFVENSEIKFLYHDLNNNIFTLPVNNNFHLWTILINKVESVAKIFDNSIYKGSFNFSATYNWNNVYDFLIGAYNNTEGTVPPGGYFLNGNIAEILIYDTIVSDLEHKLIETYLMDKYAPPVSLPADTVLTSFCPFTIKPNGYFISYLWNTGDTSSSIAITKSGKYMITTTDIFGRVSKDSMIVTFPQTNIPDTIVICYGDSALVTSALGNLVDYYWSTGSKKNYSYVKQHGWHYVTVTDLTACSTIDSFFVKVDSLSIIPLFINDTLNLCSGNLLTIQQNLSNITSYLWEPTLDSTSAIVVDQSQLYTVEVKNIYGCSNKDSIYINIIGIAPIAQYIASHTCFGDTTYFTDNSIVQDSASICEWLWIVNNSDSIYTQNFKYLFPNYGIHNVRLIVKTTNQCYDDTTKNIIIHPLPNPNFNIYGLCNNKPTYFINTSTIPFDTIVKYEWNFGDNSAIDTSKNPVHVYNLYQDYNVQLIATSNQNCVDSIVKTITIKQTPLAGFFTSATCVETPVYFIDTSKTNYYYPLIKWEWYFGDGNFSNLPNPIHVFNSVGNYECTLIVQSLNGCSDTAKKIISVSSNPIAIIANDTACAKNFFRIYDFSTAENATIINRKWIKDHQLINSSNDTIILYSNVPDTLLLYLYVETNTGCSDSVSKEIIIYPLPSISFSVSPQIGPAPLTVNFINNSSPGTSFWNFGNGDTSTKTSPQYTYLDTGSYTVLLIQQNEYTCKDSAIKTIKVVPPLYDLMVNELNFTANAGVLQFKCKIINSGTLPVTNIILKLNINSVFNVFEIIKDTILPLDFIVYNMNTIIPIPEGGIKYACLTASIDAEEINYTNNIACIASENVDNLLIIYPIPTNDYLNIMFNSKEKQQSVIKVYDTKGNLIISEMVVLNNDVNVIKLNTFKLKKGLYFLKITTKYSNFVEKFIKN